MIVQMDARRLRRECGVLLFPAAGLVMRFVPGEPGRWLSIALLVIGSALVLIRPRMFDWGNRSFPIMGDREE